ncbi:ferredoxin [Streptomyces sp. NPDC054786]
MRISVDREACTGTRLCVLFAAPDVFSQDAADGRIVLLTDRPDAGREDEVHGATDACPVVAIRPHWE